MSFRRIWGSLVVLLICSVASGVEWVEFEDGRIMEVERVSSRDGMAFLDLEGGGAIAVPLSSIVRTGTVVRPEPEPDGSSGDPVEESWRGLAGEYADILAGAAERHGLKPALLAAMAVVESGFDPFAVSPKGACGLLQLMPATAERFDVEDVFDVNQNVEGAARYLSWLIERYDGDTELALAAYNAGEGAVDTHHGIPPYRETRTYVTEVLKRADLRPGQ